MVQAVQKGMDKLEQIEFTFHVKKRWSERFHGMFFANDRDAENYVRKFHDRIMQEITEMFSEAIFIWQGQIYADQNVMCFYVKDDVVFVTCSAKKTLVTVYRVEIPIPEDIKHILIRETMNKIIEVRTKRFEYSDRHYEWFEKQRIKRERYTEQMAELQRKLNKVNQEVFEKEAFINQWKLDNEQYARVLVNSQQVANELKGKIR